MSKRKQKARRKKRVRRKSGGTDYDGYDSLFELEFSKSLKQLERKHEFHWCPHRERYEYVSKHTYLPDFFITTRSGKLIIIETKGYFTSKDRTKHKRVREAHPELDIRFVFQKDNKLSRISKTKYSDWCRQHNFKYSIGTLDKEWLDE